MMTHAVFALVVVASMLARARARGIRRRVSRRRGERTSAAFVAEDEIAGRGGNAYDSNTKLSKVKRCFSNYVFESASDPTLRWVLMSWPSSRRCRAPLRRAATFYAEGSARATLRPDVEGKYSAALVNGGDCYASRVLEIEATWTCKPTREYSVTIVLEASRWFACIGSDARWHPQTLKISVTLFWTSMPRIPSWARVKRTSTDAKRYERDARADPRNR